MRNIGKDGVRGILATERYSDWFKMSVSTREVFCAMRAFVANAPDGALLGVETYPAHRVGRVTLVRDRQHFTLNEARSAELLHSIVESDVVRIGYDPE